MSGVLGWSPETFWKATLPELLYQIRGWQRANGVDPDAVEPSFTRADYEALKAKIDG